MAIAGGGIDAASGQIELASLEGGAGRSKGGSDGNNDNAHSDNAVSGSNMGLHVAVDPPRAEMGNGGGQDNNDDDCGRHHKMLTTRARSGTANASKGRHGKMTMARGDTRRRVESTEGRMMTARRFTSRDGNGEGRHIIE
jgi:hypothetical protein